MTININYKNKKPNLIHSSTNLILFSDENYNLLSLKHHITKEQYSYIYDIIKNSDLKKDILFYDVNSKKRIFLISIKKNLNNKDIENLGAKFYENLDLKKKMTLV